MHVNDGMVGKEEKEDEEEMEKRRRKRRRRRGGGREGEKEEQDKKRNNEEGIKGKRLADSVFFVLKMKYNIDSLQILTDGREIASPPYCPKLYNAAEPLTPAQ